MESSSSSYMSLVSLPLEAHNFKLLSSDFSQNVGNFGENARVGWMRYEFSRARIEEKSSWKGGKFETILNVVTASQRIGS